MHEMVHRIDDIGKPAWITLMVLGFIAFWPVGLAVLAFLIWSGRMGCGSRRDWQQRFTGARAGSWYGSGRSHASTGNRAFDEYRDETLQRLEDEAREFRDFLEKLRLAKDRAEFDEFMSARKARPTAAGGEQPA